MSQNLKEIRQETDNVGFIEALNCVERSIDKRIKELSAERDKCVEKINNILKDTNSEDFEYSLRKHKAKLSGNEERISELNRLLGKE